MVFSSYAARIFVVGSLWVVLGGCGEPGEVSRGREVYATYCALCHGQNGEGYDSPAANAVQNEDFLMSVTDEFLIAAVEQGRPGTKMSPFGVEYLGPLSRSQVTDLIAFWRYEQEGERVEFGTEAVVGDAAAGASVFADSCAVCHGASGEGGSALSLNNAVFLATASDGFIEYAILKGRRATTMQPYETVLSTTEINDLVALIRSWEQSGANR